MHHEPTEWPPEPTAPATDALRDDGAAEESSASSAAAPEPGRADPRTPERAPLDDGHAVRMVSVPTERPREDALPEHVDYRDRGCDLFPSCLSCPLPQCRYDEPGGVRAILNRQRDHEIRRMRQETDLTVAQIAKHFRISRRTVFRALAESRPPEPGASAPSGDTGQPARRAQPGHAAPRCGRCTCKEAPGGN